MFIKAYRAFTLNGLCKVMHFIVRNSFSVQVFDSNGIFVKEFGQYGNGEGEFDCLAGVAVNRIGQYIIADRYNHRIQVLDPSGRFLRAFGSQGTADGKFNYPWGVTIDALGFIYVCDKENHRVQVNYNYIDMGMLMRRKLIITSKCMLNK